MPQDAVEILIKARNEAQGALNQAIGQLKLVEGAAGKASASSRQAFVGLAGSVAALNPAAAGAVASIQSVTAAAAGFGPAVAAVAGLTAGFGALAGAALLGARALGTAVERLDNLATATGANIEGLQVLGEVFRRQGLSADVAETALVKLNREIGEGNKFLKALGITTRDPVEALLALSVAFRGSEDQAAKTRIAFELMGRGSRDVLKVIDSLAAVFPNLRAEMAATGQLFSKDMVEAGRKFDAEWDRFTGRWEGFMNRIKGAAAAAVNAVIDAFARPTATKLEESLRVAQRELQAAKGSIVVTSEAGQKEIDRLQGVVDRIARQIKIAGGVVREFGEDDLPLLTGGAVGATDSITDLAAIMDKATEKVSEHAKRVKELVDLFGFERAAAENIIRVQEQLAQARRRAALAEELFVGPPAPKPVAFPFPERDVTRMIDRMLRGAEEVRNGLAVMLLPLEEAPSIFEATLASWQLNVEGMLSSGRILSDALSDILGNMTAAFSDVFAGLFSRFQTITGAVRNLASAVGDAIIRMVARIAAALVTLGVIKLIAAIFGVDLSFLLRLAGLPSAARAGGAGGERLAVAPPVTAGIAPAPTPLAAAALTAIGPPEAPAITVSVPAVEIDLEPLEERLATLVAGREPARAVPAPREAQPTTVVGAATTPVETVRRAEVVDIPALTRSFAAMVSSFSSALGRQLRLPRMEAEAPGPPRITEVEAKVDLSALTRAFALMVGSFSSALRQTVRPATAAAPPPQAGAEAAEPRAEPSPIRERAAAPTVPAEIAAPPRREIDLLAFARTLALVVSVPFAALARQLRAVPLATASAVMPAAEPAREQPDVLPASAMRERAGPAPSVPGEAKRVPRAEIDLPALARTLSLAVSVPFAALGRRLRASGDGLPVAPAAVRMVERVRELGTVPPMRGRTVEPSIDGEAERPGEPRREVDFLALGRVISVSLGTLFAALGRRLQPSPFMQRPAEATAPQARAPLAMPLQEVVFPPLRVDLAPLERRMAELVPEREGMHPITVAAAPVLRARVDLAPLRVDLGAILRAVTALAPARPQPARPQANAPRTGDRIEIGVQVEGSAAGFLDFMVSPLGKGRLASLLVAQSRPF